MNLVENRDFATTGIDTMERLAFDHLPYLERVKIQTEILLPLFRRMRDELGSDQACRLLRAAVREYATSLGEGISAAHAGGSLEKIRKAVPIFAAGDAVDVESRTDTAKELGFNVLKCKYADYFQQLGEPEFGAILTCEIDPPMTKGVGSDLNFERTQTRMQGASHCDFKWQQKS